MPKLKGSKLGAKSKVYTNIAKTKKPGKAELSQRGAVFQQRLANDERQSQQTE